MARDMRRLVLLSFLLLAACAHEAPPPDASAVINAERAFAARAGEVGWIPAFREFTAPDGQIAQRTIVSAPETLADTPDDGVRTLYWQPAFAGIARSGDFGFTTGPFSVDEARTPRGVYFTVWRLQPDGSWKWIWDGGPGPMTELGQMPDPSSEVATLPVAAAGVGSAEDAVAQVSALERGAAGGADLQRYLANDAHVYRAGRARAIGAEAGAAFTSLESETSNLVRAEASAAGDLVFALGEVSYVRDGQARNGYFARIWQYRPEGWRIVYDQRATPPPPPAE